MSRKLFDAEALQIVHLKNRPNISTHDRHILGYAWMNYKKGCELPDMYLKSVLDILAKYHASIYPLF